MCGNRGRGERLYLTKAPPLPSYPNWQLFAEESPRDWLEIAYWNSILKYVALPKRPNSTPIPLADLSSLDYSSPTQLLCVHPLYIPFSSSYSFGSMDHLPVELLAEIFGYVTQNDAVELRHALFVCRSWYRFLVSNKALWSTTTLNGAFCAYFMPRPQHQEIDFIIKCTDRSRNAPMTLVLDFREIYYHIYTERKDGFIREGLPSRLLNLLLVIGSRERRFPRYRRLQVTHCPLLIAPAVVNVALGPHLKALESITITSCLITQFDLLIRSMPSPRLHEVSIYEYDEPFPPSLFDSINLTTITRLTMHRLESWSGADVLLLQSFSSICYLTLSCGLKLVEDGWMKVGVYEGSHPVSLSVPLPRLHTLQLVGVIPSAILRALKLASISALHLFGDVRHQYSLTRVLGLAWVKSVKDLLVGAVSPEDQSWKEDLRILMVETEQLERLTVPVWISDLVPKKDVQIISRDFRAESGTTRE